MNIRESYRKLTSTIVEEHKKVFSLLSMDQLAIFVDAIVAAENIFIMGAGREGIALRGFAMRLAHMGKNSSWIWDDTTVGIKEGDLFIASDGCGRVGSFKYTFEKVKKAGGRLAMFTADPDGINVKDFADIVLFVRSQAYLVNRSDVVPTVQMMGNQYEQHLYMLCDVIVMLLVEKLNLTYENLEARHRNVE